MSGGVDSSVAAAMMKDAGHDVMGVTLKLWSGPSGEAPTAGCCTVSDAEDARRVAAQLDIPYYVLDHTDDFKDEVVGRFVHDYASGQTPNPCIECNRTVKFDRLLARLDDFECDSLVTGHHARSRETVEGWQLLRGTDPAKDQSYVLSMLTQHELERTRFPVGELTKKEVRQVAAGMGMRTAHKPESMDICFVGQRDYRGFLRDVAPDVFEPGVIEDTSGHQVGSHDGVVEFTVGQRRGLGIAVGEPRFVIKIDAAGSRVVVGSQDDLDVSRLELHSLTWVSGQGGDGPVKAQYRAHGDAVPAWLDSGSSLTFVEPQRAIAPGQTVAFYDDEVVLGGALIKSTS